MNREKTNKTHLRRDAFYTFDIETTTIITDVDSDGEPIRNGIIWSGQFYDGVNYDQVRSLKEVIDYLKNIEKREEDLPYKICIFVHNLSYEFQYIKDFFRWEKILCTDKRKIISAETSKLVFRCSYMLSNMSLEKFLINENVPEKYRKSKMDYLVERFPWTPISDEDYIYCKNDVVGLHLAMQHRIEDCYNNDINNLPLTSTGYVRKDCRKACSGNKSNRYRFYNERLDLETYKMLRKAFRGGNTHANKMYANKVVHNCASDDMASEYPWELCSKKFPTRFYDLKNFTQKEFEFLLNNHDRWAMLIEVAFINIRLKNESATPVPYIAVAKCDHLCFKGPEETEKISYVDNGRLLRCYGCSMVITEQDYLIIRNQYAWDEEKIIRVKYSKKKPIMNELKGQILNYYFDKTLLKQDENAPDFDEDQFYQYGKSKNKLNGIYGMHVTSLIKPDWEMDNVNHIPVERDIPEQELLDRYYESFSSFLSYQVGVWCTAYARMDLQVGIDSLINKNDPNKSDMIYCDTDSIKYLNYDDHKDAIAAINEKRIEICEKEGLYCNRDGKRYYMGIFEHEGISDKFKTFGAKKYIYGTDENFKITISGVPKKAGKKLIEDAVKNGKLKSPFEIKKGFVFHGIKLTSWYNDYINMQKFEHPEGTLYYGSNVALSPNSYTLGLQEDYEFLLEEYGGMMNEEY